MLSAAFGVRRMMLAVDRSHRFPRGRAAGDAEHVERPGGEGVGPGGGGVRHIDLRRPRRRPQRLPTLADLPGRPARRNQQRKPAVNPAPSPAARVLHRPIGCNQLAPRALRQVPVARFAACARLRGCWLLKVAMPCRTRTKPSAGVDREDWLSRHSESGADSARYVKASPSDHEPAYSR